MSARLNWHKWLVLSLLGLALSARPIGCDYSSIADKFGAEAVAGCNEKCPFQNRTGDGHFDVSCGSDCSLQQCTLGCSVWQEGLKSSCQIVCNVTSETVVSRELYCVMGCNEALNSYFQKLRELIGTPPAPALVADSLTATSLALVWEAPNLGNISHLVQWRYEELSGSWQYCSNTSHSDRSIIHVEDLKPYTKYRFRVAIFLSSRGGTGEPVYSAPSVVISTMDSGKPSSAPLALRAVAPDSTRISISWEPGPFPNGPLISYVLRLTDTQPNTVDALEEMPALNKTLFYMFQYLNPAREYEVSVAMRNGVGEGPRASVKISTPPLPTSVPSQQPILILGGDQNVLAAPANDMLTEPVELYSTNYKITGIGLDVSSDSLFVSISAGYVYRTSLSKKSSPIPILSPENISFKPLDISVDWLNRHLYILGEVNYNKDLTNSSASLFSKWEILRYDFDGKNQVVALSGYFNSRPIHFEVDAYNGYLFWVLRGAERGGLYRLDLANMSNGVRHNAPPEFIVRDAHLGAFTVDYTEFRLLVAHLIKNTVIAVSLDGREVINFRSNTQKPMFKLTRSIAYVNGLFYWTNGDIMLTEEYHDIKDSYFHNEYPINYKMHTLYTRQVLVALRNCQPIPIPVNPPIGVQSVMGINRAKVSWSPPHLLGHQGSGAWQQWTYHLQLTHVESGETINKKNISEMVFVVENLKQDSTYVVRVAAVTASGTGPWSSEFVGKTLESSPTTLHSTLIWSGPDGLLQTDLTGENLQTLIHRTQLKNLLITDISWYRDKLYLVTNASTVLWYNITSHEKGVMANMDNVGSLAVDWVGKKIYWSNPKQQLITRGNFDGTNIEPVPIVTVAKELTIDALGAYIYWNTGHAIEAARLNGENKIVYYPAQLFSGKQVMGLALDLEGRWLYWLVRSYDGSELHRAPTAEKIVEDGIERGDTLISRLSGTMLLGPLVYYCGRLVWVAGAGRGELVQLAGAGEGRGERGALAEAARHTALLLPRVQVMAVRDPTLHANSENLIAIPETIDSSSIAVKGTWDNFNVTWDPATRVNVNNSKIYYDVSLVLSGQHKIERTVDTPYISIRGGSVPPYSALEVTVRAQAAWGGGGAARARGRSPPHRPARPARPRLYLHPAARDSLLTAIFRWEVPPQANGIIRGYKVQCWTTPSHNSSRSKSSACADVLLPPSHTQLILRELANDSTYYFKVSAFTDAGPGPYSETVSCSSDQINPIPRVIMSSQDSIKIIDLDSGESEIIPKNTGIPIDFAVSIEENVVYWANNLEEIFSSRINSSGQYKLTSINGSATSLCVDWVGRSVYWSQLEMISTVSYVLYRADLSVPNIKPHITRIFARRQPIYNLQISPLTRSLYWYEESTHPGLGTLMTSYINGQDIRIFFNQSKNTMENCSCPENPQVAKTFFIDMTSRKTELFWVDPWVHHINAADMNGCHCRTVVDATDKKKYGFTPMSISVDSKYIYWFNSTEQAIFYTDKNKKNKIEHIKTSYGYKIMTLDINSQHYPPTHCLYPRIQNLRPAVLSNSANSITLKLPRVSKPHVCEDLEYEMTAMEYTIFYRLQNLKDETICDRESCPFITTTNSEVVIGELRPFTNYTVMLEVTNYYTKLHEIKPITSSSMVLQTAAEAPTAPKDVKFTVLSPVLAKVEWTPEPGLWYELHWRTAESSSLPHRLKEHNRLEVVPGQGLASLPALLRLAPHTQYAAWLRARSPHSAAPADTSPTALTTFPMPNNIIFKNATAYQLKVFWDRPTAYQLHKYHVQYIEASFLIGDWLSCSPHDNNQWIASNLRPKTRYRFRLRLQYVPDGPPYEWPDDDRFTFETLSDVPSAPGPLRVEAIGERVLRVWWSEPDPRGAPIEMYRIWGRPQHRSSNLQDSSNTTKNMSELLPANLPEDVDEDMRNRILREELELLHNGTESYWVVGAESLPGGYWAQAQAGNSAGWGALGAAAALQPPPAPAAPAPPRARAPGPALLAALGAALGALLLTVAVIVICTYNNRSKKKSIMDNPIAINVPRRGPDVELATLRQLPIRHSTNILYNQGVHCPSDAELATLPHIRREQITLTKFLGAGAFGEVFEGVARQINGTTTDTKVAVKTLQKGATEQEKTEFLKEAVLMSNFKHEHILRLLGVCLDNDPNYIIMELMEGGDLLSYLRAKRASLYTPESLTLLDLLNMCVDVTKGCRYLEEMHFVHRDLACRNCLVAHRGDGRVVKIGDFGLARDIYKNDYYRKEGEGLLPVRWMAVECMMDGVFSCQSDVWAWGVLCWEVLSLGQQPYPARTNREVLGYVRAGGKPDRPPNCPSDFYDLLQKCWSYSPESRPSFRQCLEVVTALRDKTSPNITLTATATPTQHYLTLLGDDAVDNRTYLLDENDNTLDEDIPEQQMQPSRLLPQPTKYLELMYDSDSTGGATVCDGYEIPRAPCTPFSRHSIVGVAPNRLIKPPLYRTHSLRTRRPPNATIIPLRNGIMKRASLCEDIQTNSFRELPSSSRDLDKYVFKTPF